MLVRTVKMSSKGRITIPKAALQATALEAGSELILVQQGERIFLLPPDGLIADRPALLSAFAEVWDHPEDVCGTTFGSRTLPMRNPNPVPAVALFVPRVPPPHPRRYELRLDRSRLVLLGTIQGLKGESARVQEAWDRLGGADVLALGVGPEDVRNLHRMGEHPEGIADFMSQDLDTGSYEEAILPQLSRFGDIAMPPDDLLAAEMLARRAGVPLEALDLDDDAHSDLYVAHVSGWQMIRGQLKQKRLVAKDVEAVGSAEELMLLWDAAFTSISGYGKVEEAREEHMAAGVRALAARYDRVLVVVPYARVAGLARRLQDVPPAQR